MVRLRDIFFLCLNHWRWFTLSLIVTMGCAAMYLLVTPRTYTCKTSILIKSDEKNNGADEQLKELGINQTSSNMTNEILSLNTLNIASEIVNRLDLDVDYFHDAIFHKEIVYGLDLPVLVRFENLNDNETVSLTLELSSNGKATITDMVRNGNMIDGVLTLKLGDTVKTPLGKISVQPSPYYKKGVTDNLHVVRSNINSVIGSVRGRISAELRDKNSTIIDIKYKDVSVARAEDVLNTLVSVYNENWIKDRNRITVSTNDFIKERLSVIERELGSVDQDISTYKSEHLVPDVQQVSGMAMSQAAETEQQTRALDNQLYMARYIRNYLTDGRHENQLLPANSGINNPSIEQQISEYNEILLKRNKHLAISSAQNPLVMDLDQNLSTMRRTIIHSLDNELTMLKTQHRTVQSSHSQATAKIAANPKQAKYLLSVERQQKVKESLYLFLLQKREENELSQAFTAYNTSLIEEPHEGAEPAEPIKSNIMLMAFAIGLALPGMILFVRENMNTAVRGRKDLEQLNVPFVGELPLLNQGKKEAKKNKHSSPKILVVEKSVNVMNEAFRVVRTNLEFVLGFDGKHHVIMLTSINPGSGKTFITANLSASLGIKGKKVIAIDLDLRRGSLSHYIEKTKYGISNYLSGQCPNYQDLIVTHDSIDILPCGTIPPNPTELLFSSRFKTLIEELREQYDYVFIDCPPVEIVADASIINRYVDLTLFVIRAQVLDRAFLPDIERWYNEKKFTNLSIILNCTTDSFSHYGYHKYGYHYGYKYGYGHKG
ncbi:MAG: polysaccharide biosynthesis tyrosine autokinase [Prevotellaceae bacterium]|nr:polysaccharide biosynthesis tyrosine autokinase [Prevotellaceae bacterium]